MNDINGEWEFFAYKKEHDNETGEGYYLEDFDGNKNYIAYE